MRLIILYFLFCSNCFAQSWSSYNNSIFVLSGQIYDYIGNINNEQSCQLSQFDNSIWCASSNRIIQFKNGQMSIHNNNTSSILPLNLEIMDFAFINSNVFAVDYNLGLFKYDGIIWTNVAVFDKGTTLSTFNDTIYVSRLSQNIVKYYNGFNFTESFSGNCRYTTNGILRYGSADLTNLVYKFENGVKTFIDHTTTPLLSQSCFDMKFKPNTDTMYVACGEGFGRIFNNIVFDSIDTQNSTNMPVGKIIEFEFDPEGNVWCLFGPSWNIKNTLAKLNLQTMEWSDVFTESNSPLTFQSATLEIDAAGNVYVIQSYDLAVLSFNNPPSWLGVAESVTKEVSIFPNPCTSSFTIESKKGNHLVNVEIFSNTGELLVTTQQNTVDLSELSHGSYFAICHFENGLIVRKKIVKD